MNRFIIIVILFFISTLAVAANPNVKPSKIVQSWGTFNRDNLDLNLLGKFRQEAIRIFDKTGWK